MFGINRQQVYTSCAYTGSDKFTGGDKHLLRRERYIHATFDGGERRRKARESHRGDKRDVGVILRNGPYGGIFAYIRLRAEFLCQRVRSVTVGQRRERNDAKVVRMFPNDFAGAFTYRPGGAEQNDTFQRCESITPRK